VYEHPIPPMTHELSRHWDQPPREDVVVTDEFAFMTKKSWEKLAEYNSTNPSGAYEGKMWRAHETVHTGYQYKTFWDRPFLCWYGVSPHKDRVSINWRPAVFVDQGCLLLLQTRRVCMPSAETWETWYETIGIDHTRRPSADQETWDAWLDA
jgi:hypothetical protein